MQDVNGLPRFQEEFGSPEDTEEPEASDFKQTFHGNIDGAMDGGCEPFTCVHDQGWVSTQC